MEMEDYLGVLLFVVGLVSMKTAAASSRIMIVCASAIVAIEVR